MTDRERGAIERAIEHICTAREQSFVGSRVFQEDETPHKICRRELQRALALLTPLLSDEYAEHAPRPS